MLTVACRVALPLLLLLLVLLLDDRGASAELGRGGRLTPLCFTNNPSGGGTDFVLTVSQDLGSTLQLTGHVLLSTPPPKAGLPLHGVARRRGDDRLDFLVTSGSGTQVLHVTGRLEPPGYDSGTGFLTVMNAPGTTVQTFTPIPCPAEIGDVP